MDRVMVAKIELQMRSVTDFELLKLCETIGVSPSELLGLKSLPRDLDQLRTYLKPAR